MKVINFDLVYQIRFEDERDGWARLVYSDGSFEDFTGRDVHDIADIAKYLVGNEKKWHAIG